MQVSLHGHGSHVELHFFTTLWHKEHHNAHCRAQHSTAQAHQAIQGRPVALVQVVGGILHDKVPEGVVTQMVTSLDHVSVVVQHLMGSCKNRQTQNLEIPSVTLLAVEA